jgi:hypothetical protein
MNIYLVVGKSTITENFILRVWEASADGPGAHVYEDLTTLVEKNAGGVPTVGAGHQIEEPLTIPGMDSVTHIVRIIGATSGTVWAKYTHNPTVLVATITPPIQFKIGDGGPETPAANSDTCTNAALIGLTTDDFVIHRNNYGDLHPTTHFGFTSGTGTWQLNAPDQFGDNEEFTIKILPQIIANPVHDSVVGKQFGGFVDVSANTNYAASHLRKLIRFAGQCTYTFQLGDTIPIGYPFCFTNLGTPTGTGICTVQFLNGNLKWGSTTKTTIDLSLYTEAAFVWDGTQWNVWYIADSRTWQSSTIPPGTILGSGVYNIGDVAAGDPIYTVTHNLDITGDYHVLLQVKSNSNSTYFRDNKLCSTWYHDPSAPQKKNKFYFSLQEISGEVQNVSVVWLIIKA